MGSVFLEEDTLEIQSDGDGGHVGFFLSDVDAKEFGTCGVTDAASAGEHHRHAHAADALHGMRPSSIATGSRGLGANECANSPNKYVEVLAVSDESFYALKGDASPF